MQKSLFIFITLLLIPLCYADISITGIESKYNLDEKIIPSIDIDFDTPFNGFLTAELNCPSYSNDYYKSPVSIEGQEIISLPPLPVFPEMKGTCTIKVYFEDIGKSTYEEEKSEEFEVTDSLKVDLSYSENKHNPGDNFNIQGSLYNIRGEPIKGTLLAKLSGTEHNFVITNSSFDFNIPLLSDITSGENRIFLSFEDNDGNYVDKLIYVDIEPMPTSISLALDDDLYLPYEALNAEILLLDQANDSIESEIDIKVMKDNKELYYFTSDRGTFNIQLNNSWSPGKYQFLAYYWNIESIKDFEIAEYQKISAQIDGQKAIITNLGNVDYKNNTPIVLTDGEKEVVINKKLSLSPSESKEIDLSKETEEGDYTVTLPDGELLNSIHIDDNRNILKKTASGISAVTGNVVKAVKTTGKISLSFIIFFLIVIVGIAGLEYSGYPVMSTMSTKSKEIASKVLSRFKKKN